MNGIAYKMLRKDTNVVIYVDPPHRPEGWWYGKTASDAVQTSNGAYGVDVVVTQPMDARENNRAHPLLQHTRPMTTCFVFEDSPETVQLVYFQQILQNKLDRSRQSHSELLALFNQQARSTERALDRAMRVLDKLVGSRKTDK